MKESFFIMREAIRTYQSFWIVRDSFGEMTRSGVTAYAVGKGDIEAITGGLNAIAKYDMGFSDVISVIAIPLIIMLFAFALPFLFNIVNHINSKYDSKVLSGLFESHSSYRWFWCLTYFSIGYIFVLGAIHLLLWPDYAVSLSIITSWCSLVVALAYSSVVLLFIRYCVKFNKAEKLVEIIEKAFQKDQKRRPSLLWRIKRKIREWWHRKDAEWLRVYKQALRFTGGWGQNEAEGTYNQRLIALCKYALRKHDVTLFYTVMEGVDKVQKKEKWSTDQSFGKPKDELSDGAPHYLTSRFFDEIFEFYATCQQEKNIEDTLVWKWLASYNRSTFVSIVDIIFLSRTLLKLCNLGQQLLLEKYIDRSSYYFAYVPNLPRVKYVEGYSPAKRSFVELKSSENWNNLCNFHFLVFSYALSKGLYDLLPALQSRGLYWDHQLFPQSVSDVLIRYARCKSNLKERGYYGHWKVEDIYGKKVDVEENIGRYTMLLLFIASGRADRQTEDATSSDLEILMKQKTSLIAYAKSLQQDARLLAVKNDIKRIDVEKVYDKAVRSIYLYVNRATENKEHSAEKDTGLLRRIANVICPSKYNKPRRTHKQAGEKNWYREAVDKKKTVEFEDRFNSLFADICRYIPEQYLPGEGVISPEEIEINECVLLVDKLFFMLADDDMYYQLYMEYLDVITNRIAYAMLTAYQRMIIEEVSLTPADLNHFIDEQTKDHTDEYLLVDVESHFDSWLVLNYGDGFKTTYKGIPYLRIESVGRFDLLRDLPANEFFKNSLILVTKQCQPHFINNNKNNNIQFNYTDESSEEKKKLSIRVGVDLNKRLIFNPKDTICVIRTKKMTV